MSSTTGLRRAFLRRFGLHGKVASAAPKTKLGLENLESRDLPSFGLHLDLGTSGSPVQTNYTRMPFVSYNPIRGYGWTSLSGMTAYDVGTSNALTRDGHQGKDNEFKVDLPNGIYDVTATIGHPTVRRDKLDILAEGQLKASNLSTNPKQSLPVTFQVQVTDGQLNLRFTDKGGRDPYFSLSALDIESVSTTPPTVVNAGLDKQGQEGSAVSFVGSASSSLPLTYLWNFGDGTSTAGTLTPSHTYADNGVYTATLTVTNAMGLSFTDATLVTVANVAPTANPNGPYSGLTGTAMAFRGTATDPSSADTTAGFRYQWNFGDGTTSTQQNPSKTYTSSGNYTVTLIATDKDGATHTKTTTATIAPPSLPPPPTVNAGPDKTGQEGSSVALAGSATGSTALSYHWNFGDGTTATGTLTPSHTYADNGIYNALLTVTDTYGQSSSDSVKVTVGNVSPTANANGPYLVLTNTAVAFKGSATDPSSTDTAAGFNYQWNFGDGTTSTQQNPSKTYSLPGIYTVTLTTRDKDGGATTQTTTATILLPSLPPPPTANAGLDKTGQEGSSVALAGSATGSTALSYHWNFGDGTTATGTLTPGHTYADNGVYTAILTVTDTHGQFSTDVVLVTVGNVAPTATFSNSGATTEGTAVTLTVASPSDPSTTDTAAGFRYSFDFNNDGTYDVVDATSPTASFAFADNGTFVVKGRIKDKDGGATVYSTSISVANVAPTANPNGPYTGLTAANVAFHGSATDPGSADTTAGFSYQWNFGDGTTSAQQNPSKTYTTAGTYTVTLTTTDKDGAAHTQTTTATITTPVAPGEIIQTPHYKIPNFGANPTVVSTRSGSWSDPTIWSTGQVPGENAIVAINAGTTVTFDMGSTAALDTVAINPGGLLTFRTDVNTKLLVTNLLVLEGGELRIGTAANAVPANVKAEVVIRNVPLDTTRDPEQFGNGLVALGKVSMHGASKLTEVRLAAEPLAGHTTLTLSEPATGWQVGDRLILPDSKQWEVRSEFYASQYEEPTIASISADGKTITLTAALLYDHPGARNGDGVLDFLPHVANRTRSVVVKSESSSGNRGHVLFTYHADVDVRFATFIGTGRTTLDPINNTTFNDQGGVTHIGTNQSDRHPVNFAHLVGPAGGQANGFQYTFTGNAVFCGLPTHRVKWGITINDSHYGLIKDNVLYNWAGAGLATAAGNESFNVIEGNIAIRGRGEGDREGMGNEGSAFWFRGPNNYVRNNVGANYVGNSIEAAYGFKLYFQFLGNIRIPKFQGADTSVDGQYVNRLGTDTPILEFSGNEAYGVESGMTYWWVNTYGPHPGTGGESVIKDFRVWNPYLYGVYGYNSNRLTMDGLVVRGSERVGLFIGDYFSKDFVLTHADIQGMNVGINYPSTITGGTPFTIKDSYFRNVVDINVGTLYTSGYRGDHIPPRTIIIRNVKFDGLPGKPHTAIAMSYTNDSEAVLNLTALDAILVYDYNQIVGNNFQVYYAQQVATFVLPQSTYNSDSTLRRVGSPEAGLTNQQNWDKYGIALAGAVAPANATTMLEIDGLIRRF